MKFPTFKELPNVFNKSPTDIVLYLYQELNNVMREWAAGFHRLDLVDNFQSQEITYEMTTGGGALNVIPHRLGKIPKYLVVVEQRGFWYQFEFDLKNNATTSYIQIGGTLSGPAYIRFILFA